VKRTFKAEPTLAEFFNEYGIGTAIKKLSWRDDQQRFRDYLQKPALAKPQADRDHRAMIARMRCRMLRRPASPRRRCARFGRWRRTCFGKAVEWGYWTRTRRNPSRCPGSTVKPRPIPASR
jgi:hypothetical protein